MFIEFLLVLQSRKRRSTRLWIEKTAGVYTRNIALRDTLDDHLYTRQDKGTMVVVAKP